MCPALAVHDRPWQYLAPATRRDRPPASGDLPDAGGRPLCEQRQFSGPVLSYILTLFGCGMGTATLWQYV